VQINRTNNATEFAFDGRDLSIMEAVALRDRLTLEAKARRAVVDAVEQGLETGKSARVQPGFYAASPRRSKDDVRKLPQVNVASERKVADELSERVRRLDIALQQRNWTTELVD
jgi:hypothetical protein